MIEENQQLGARAKAGLHVYPFRHFPYSLVYPESNAGPYIRAVAHQRQEPGYWIGRVQFASFGHPLARSVGDAPQLDRLDRQRRPVFQPFFRSDCAVFVHS